MKSRDGGNNKRKKILVVEKKDGVKVPDDEKGNGKVEEAAQNIINRAKQTLNKSKEAPDSKSPNHEAQIDSKEDLTGNSPFNSDRKADKTVNKDEKVHGNKPLGGMENKHGNMNKIDEDNRNEGASAFESEASEREEEKSDEKVVEKTQHINETPENGKTKENTPKVSSLSDTNSTGKNDKKPHVSIDEKQNKSHSVKSDPHKAVMKDEYKPAILMAPVNNSKLIEYRADEAICAEGSFFKQRVIFSCFWHQKYFVLMKDGKLVYHKLDGSRYAKGNWEISKADSLTKIEKPGSWHPYRLAFNLDGSVRYFGYDLELERDYWFSKFEKFAKK